MSDKASAILAAITDYVYWSCREVEESIRNPGYDSVGRRKDESEARLREALQEAFEEPT